MTARYLTPAQREAVIVSLNERRARLARLLNQAHTRSGIDGEIKILVETLNRVANADLLVDEEP